MQVKRFVAASMRLALQMVREEVGPDAIILSNKRVPEGVEILTAIEQPVSEASPVSTNPFLSADSPLQADTNVAVAPPSKLEIELEQMQQEARQRAKLMAATLAKQNSQRQEALHSEMVSLVAGSTDIEAQTVAEESNQPAVVEPAPTQAAAVEPAAQSLQSEAKDGELSVMRAELQSMRDLLEQQLSTLAWGQFSQQKPEQASLWRRLKRMGVTAAVSDRLLNKTLPSSLDGSEEIQDHWQLLMKQLSQQLKVVGEDLTADGGVFAFVGPTGAGKTTTIGKLATRYVLENGADSVALITTDTARIAAHEQLRTFGRILNVPVKVVDKNNSLERVLYSLRHRSLILIDTAGLNRQDPRLKQQLTALNELANRVKTVLVIPTTSQVEVIKAAYHSYKTDNLSCCVFTKLDEATSLGGAISLSLEQDLPIAYSTDGQDIPDDIAFANSRELIRVAIELAKHNKIDDDAMIDEMASLSRA